MAKPAAANSDGTAKRSKGRPFVKGRSGNPDGRPKLPAELRERAQHFAVEMLDVLRGLAVDENEKGAVRVAAASAILDRAYGRPVAPVIAAATDESWGAILEGIVANRRRPDAGDRALLIEHSPDEP